MLSNFRKEEWTPCPLCGPDIKAGWDSAGDSFFSCPEGKTCLVGAVAGVLEARARLSLSEKLHVGFSKWTEVFWKLYSSLTEHFRGKSYF